MLKHSLTVAAFLALGVGCTQSTEELGGKSNPQLAADDNAYFKRMTVANLTEIESSKLALNQSTDASVKQFAQKMIDDHTIAGNKLAALAASKNVMLPQHLDSTHQTLVDKLKDKSGKDFDSAYEALQISAHKEAITIDQSEAQSGSDSDTRALASELLSTLKMHSDMANRLQETGNTGM